MSIDTVPNVLRKNCSLRALRSAARQCILMLVVAGLQFSVSPLFAQPTPTELNAKQCTSSSNELSKLMIACLQSIPIPKLQPEYISQEQYEDYIAEEIRKGQEALKQMRDELEKREREAWLQKFREDHLQEWIDAGGPNEYIDAQKKANPGWDDCSFAIVNWGGCDSWQIEEKWKEEIWKIYSEQAFQKYLDDLMRQAVKAEEDRIWAMRQNHLDTLASLYGAFAKAFGNCFANVNGALSSIYKTCTGGSGYPKGIGMYCASVKLSVAACKAKCIQNSEYPGFFVPSMTLSVSCDQCRAIDKPMCWPPNATVPLIRGTFCPEAGQTARSCLKSCEAGDETKRAECRENCSEIFKNLWALCTGTSAALPANPTPAEGSPKQRGDRTGSKLRTYSSSTKTFGVEKEKTNAKTTAPRNNNLDRPDATTLSRTTRGTSSSSSSPKSSSQVLSPSLLERGGGFATQGPSATGTPLGGSRGGADSLRLR